MENQKPLHEQWTERMDDMGIPVPLIARVAQVSRGQLYKILRGDATPHPTTETAIEEAVKAFEAIPRLKPIKQG